MELAELHVFEPEIFEPYVYGIGGNDFSASQRPYIKGHITGGASTFTFKVNNQDVTVDVGADGWWKYKPTATVTSLANLAQSSLDEIEIYVSEGFSINNVFRNANGLKKVKVVVCSEIGAAFPITTGLASLVSAEIVCTAATSINSTFYGQSQLKSVVIKGDTTNVINYSSFINGCNELEYLEYPYIGAVSTNNNLNRIFEGLTNPKLKEFRIGSINNNLNLSPFALLSEDSIVSIFNAMSVNNKTLTFHSTIGAMIDEQLEIDDSPIYTAYWNKYDEGIEINYTY